MRLTITYKDVINSQCLTFGTKFKLACAKSSFFCGTLSYGVFENPAPELFLRLVGVTHEHTSTDTIFCLLNDIRRYTGPEFLDFVEI